MSDPSEALQRAVVTALRASGALATAMGGAVRVYDRVPPAHGFPYLTVGEDQILDDGNSCGPASEAFVTVHAWSREVGKQQLKRIVALVRTTLEGDLPVDGQRTLEGLFREVRYLRDPDGLTEHAVIEFRYLLEPVEA